MSKLKNPFFSLGSKGSLGKTISTQERGNQTVITKFHKPSYTQTLPQLYQRWLYEDYCSYWHEHTPPEKQVYSASGSKHHLTGYQYFIKYHLTYMPDIRAWYKLDSVALPHAVDSGKFGNHATRIGAILADGVISNAYFFDGINDQLVASGCDSLTLMPPLSYDFFVIRRLPIEPEALFQYGKPGGLTQCACGWNPPNKLFFQYYWNGSWRQLWTPHIPTAGVFYHYGFTCDDVTVRFYIDGIPQTPQALLGPMQSIPDSNLFIGSNRDSSGFAHVDLDNLIFYNRIIDSKTMLSHSLRRYPL